MDGVPGPEGERPSDEQLSAYRAEKRLLGRGGKPVSPSSLRLLFVRRRVYNVWAEQRVRTEVAAQSDIAHASADWGITAQYNKPVTPPTSLKSPRISSGAGRH
ncbi:hypothetical protein SAV14893_091450 [Streptomyces avermitilis]|uniref:Uncharacterized protein n=1 Tax=Streptomyces avermitilis TaxID=33903 RepID=A0A4D4N627_STRAX|nr:hypothetical protein SAVMC3_05030 [Streptomyces avermitilis]GDY69752.1 hypothetical protein SAV14893_091450 [Streptomyces avermitilis]GDY80011.1 hypothetical protein SAV31267_094960 [Streptomyces avermitilis]